MTLLRTPLSAIPLLAFLVLAGSPAAAGAEVPLSMPPMAPLPGVTVLGAAVDGAEISLLFASQERLFVQQLTAAGVPIDPVATPVELIASFWTSYAWTGERWIVAQRNGTKIEVAWIDPDGTSTPWHDTGVRSVLPALRPAGGRRFLLAVDPLPNAIETFGLTVFEIDAAGGVTPRSDRAVTRLVRGFGVVHLNQGAFPISWDKDYSLPESPAVFRIHGAGDHAQWSIPEAFSVGFYPGTDRGGLALWYEEGLLRGAIADSEGSFSQPFTLGTIDAWPDNTRVAATEEGWVVLASGWNVAAIRMFEVTAAGSVVDRGEIGGGGENFRTARILPAGSEVLFFSSERTGISIERLAGSTAEPVASAGRSRAAQFDARTAEGPGIDLAVWNEQGDGGLVLRVGRITPDGMPLDGEGILLREPSEFAYNAHDVFELVWDGHSFVVVWWRPTPFGWELVLRRITTDGTLLEPEPIVIATSESSSLRPLDLAAAGDGRSAVAWSEDHHGGGIFLAPIEGGVPGDPVVVTQDSSVTGPAIVWNGERYVVIWDDYIPCQVLCPHIADSYAQAFDIDARALGAAVLVKAGGGTGAHLAVVGGKVITITTADDPSTNAPFELAVLEDDFTLSPLASLAAEGSAWWLVGLCGRGGEIVLEGAMARSIYSMSGELLRHEPIPVGPEEEMVAPLRERSILLTHAGPDRLALRDGIAEHGDLAVVAWPRPIMRNGSWLAAFELENRGTTPISRVELSSQFPIEGSGQYLVIEDMEIAPGESTIVLVSAYVWDGVLGPVTLRARPDVIDETPENNVATFAAPPPAGRRRAVARP